MFLSTRTSFLSVATVVALAERAKLRNTVLRKVRAPVALLTGLGLSNALSICNTIGRWPEKSIKHILRILKNAEANAEQKTIDGETLKIRSVVVQQARKNHRRTYRAHGRINRYDGHPCHVEVRAADSPRYGPPIDLCGPHR